MNIQDTDFFDKISLEQYLMDKFAYLQREKQYFQAVLQQKPKDLTAMSMISKIDSDIAVLTPIIDTTFKLNLKDVQKMTGKRFAYLMNRDVSKKDIQIAKEDAIHQKNES